MLRICSLTITQWGAAPIVVGQTSGCSGASEASVKEMTAWGHAHLDAVDARSTANAFLL